MQSELDRFYSWTTKNKLQINSKKCMTMQFSRSRSYDFPMDYFIGGSNILEERDTLQILGVQVQSDLRWDMQMVARARTSWVLQRMRAVGVDQNTLV